MPINVYVETTTGSVRSINEDFVIADKDNKIFIVADGVGGSQAGEIASEYVATELHRFLSSYHIESHIQENLNTLLIQINKNLIRKSDEDPILVGMSTTLVFSILTQEGFLVGNIGDSRCYLLRNKHLSQITKDHSVVQQLLDSGTINEEEAFNHHLKHLITMAMGNETIKPDFFEFKFIEGDILILCSDGLSDLVSNSEIESILNLNTQLDEKVKMLINKALEYGGFDNISIILINKSWD